MLEEFIQCLWMLKEVHNICKNINKTICLVKILNKCKCKLNDILCIILYIRLKIFF